MTINPRNMTLYTAYEKMLMDVPAVADVLDDMRRNAAKQPNMSTLLEEVAEAILASRGKHEHPLRLELVQIAGICLNIIAQMDFANQLEPSEKEKRHDD